MTLSLWDIDSSILCAELARRFITNSFTAPSLLFGSYKVTLTHHFNSSSDGTKTRANTKKMTKLKFEVPDLKLIRELERRIYGGNHYAYREFTRAIRQCASVRLSPVDRWKKI